MQSKVWVIYIAKCKLNWIFWGIHTKYTYQLRIIVRINVTIKHRKRTYLVYQGWLFPNYLSWWVHYHFPSSLWQMLWWLHTLAAYKHHQEQEIYWKLLIHHWNRQTDYFIIKNWFANSTIFTLIDLLQMHFHEYDQDKCRKLQSISILPLCGSICNKTLLISDF